MESECLLKSFVSENIFSKDLDSTSGEVEWKTGSQCSEGDTQIGQEKGGRGEPQNPPASRGHQPRAGRSACSRSQEREGTPGQLGWGS